MRNGLPFISPLALYALLLSFRFISGFVCVTVFLSLHLWPFPFFFALVLSSRFISGLVCVTVFLFVSPLALHLLPVLAVFRFTRSLSFVPFSLSSELSPFFRCGS